LALLFAALAHGQQMADPAFDARVPNPAYRQEHPAVMIDEAHNNFHTADGRYQPLADLLWSDGYRIVRGWRAFSAARLKDARVLVVANALGPGATAGTDTSKPAFTETECETVRDWVLGGGSLLLISDHTPFGMAAENLAAAIGVKFGKGFVSAAAPRYSREGRPTMLVFSRENGLLGEHPITRGIQTVVAFTGQSLSVPEGATILMKIAPEAKEAPSRAAMRTGENHPPLAAQGIAMTLGKGRVVVLGEAAMMSAQVVRTPGRPDVPMGMNAPGSDDRQFALNVLHWLSALRD
jgi:hypothetical protein